ncbi:hypothetical protein LC605_22860 [Nostoc sp. CHAB 5836]|uniref:hypothetical protein n=1 Tax=Nostoc sp. CHAB 5836 TaxID=2780404 RepID=UPI001E4DB166|nr:hypothetical protein [Nostoc sp. CHAB 5836]MCC5617871.1 hypothetical protein [Nostoc sp. CHAB 5836]
MVVKADFDGCQWYRGRGDELLRVGRLVIGDRPNLCILAAFVYNFDCASDFGVDLLETRNRFVL